MCLNGAIYIFLGEFNKDNFGLGFKAWQFAK